MEYEKFLAIFKMFIDGDVQSNTIRLGDYIIKYSAPSWLSPVDELTYYKGNTFFGSDYIDRGGVRDIQGNIIFHTNFGARDSSYTSKNIKDFKDFEDYLDYSYSEFLKAKETFKKSQEEKERQLQEYREKLDSNKVDILKKVKGE